VLAALGAAFVAETTVQSKRLLLLVSILLAAGLAGLILGAYVVMRFRNANEKLGRIAEALGGLRRRPGVVAFAFVVSLLIQSGLVGLNILIGVYAGAEATVAAWFFSWPLAKLAALLPITLGGLGVRESALILLMKPLGADPSAVAATGILWQTILFAGGIFGGLVALNVPSSASSSELSTS
jgi:uncharacterized membrane protein YbhN (UPF0104 family)